MSASDTSAYGIGRRGAEFDGIASASAATHSGDTDPMVGSGELERSSSVAADEERHVTNHSGLACYWVDGVPLPPRHTAVRSVELIAKRAFDIVASGLALIALAPLLIVIAVAIRVTDPGPVLFRQVRIGRHGKPFSILKFRSMYADQCDDSGVAQTVAGDQRIMPLGQFLRRTSIDELPQLINILIGHMSLVGPRPHVAGQMAAKIPYEEVVPYYSQRYVMRPGLTGWAQANGLRGPTDDAGRAKARIDHDIAYIQNFSLALDIRILLQTIRSEFFTGSGF